MYYPLLFESPDSITVDGNKIHYNDINSPIRSFILFDTNEVWVSKIGEIHNDVKKYDVASPTLNNSLAGRIWLEPKIISFWHNPVVLYKNNYVEKIHILEKAFLPYKIDMKEYKYDLYDIWNYMPYKVWNAEILINYHKNGNTPVYDYHDFMKILEECNNYKNPSTIKDELKNEKKVSAKGPGSYGTSWDSKNNIRYRMTKNTSESFYPQLK